MSSESWSLKAAGAERVELSIAIATSALLRGGRLFEPEKMTSSMEEARIDLYEDSPMTQRSASTRFDLPQPLGPTTPVSPGSIRKSVGSTKDLKPSNRSLVSFIALRPHAFFLLAQDSLRHSFARGAGLAKAGIVIMRNAGRAPVLPSALALDNSASLPGAWPRIRLYTCRVGRRMNRRARKGNCRAGYSGGFPDISGRAGREKQLAQPGVA